MPTAPAGRAAMLEAGAELARMVGSAILVKGGHAGSDPCDDFLFWPSGKREVFSGPRIQSLNTRGTGCALSAWIATRLACGDELGIAVGSGKEALSQALVRHAKEIWTGAGPAFR